MKKLWLISLSAALLFSLFGMTAFAIVGTASAHVAQRSLPQVSCSGKNCNGKDPVKTGCADKKTYTVLTKESRNAKVELRYSPTCRTNWGQVTSKVGRAHLLIRVQRIDGLTYTFDSGKNKITSAHSAMVL